MRVQPTPDLRLPRKENQSLPPQAQPGSWDSLEDQISQRAAGNPEPPAAGRRPPQAGWGPLAFPGLPAASSGIPLESSRPNAIKRGRRRQDPLV